MTIKIIAVLKGEKMAIVIDCSDPEHAQVMKNAVLSDLAGRCTWLTYLEVSEG